MTFKRVSSFSLQDGGVSQRDSKRLVFQGVCVCVCVCACACACVCSYQVEVVEEVVHVEVVVALLEAVGFVPGLLRVAGASIFKAECRNKFIKFIKIQSKTFHTKNVDSTKQNKI